MKKLFSIILSITLLAGCSVNSSSVPTTSSTEIIATSETVEVEGLSILAPQGAPALSLIPIKNEDKNEITTVEGSDPLQAAFVSPTSEYDVIIAPTNLGVKLAAAGKTNYKLLAIVDWGNLYIVGNSDKEDILNDETTTITAFGQDAVPGLVFSNVYEDKISSSINWVSTVQDAMASLVSGQSDAALLAEPVATASIAKAKENNINLSVISNVEEEWGENGFPMAAMFVNSETYEENKDKYNSMLEKMATYADNTIASDDKSELIDDINEATVEFYGVPSAEIISKCYERINIKITPIDDCKEDVSKFLSLFGVDSIDNALIS